MALTNEYIIQRLKEKFGEDLFTFQESYGMLELVAPKEMNLKVLNFLYDDAQLQFRFLTDLTGVHFPNRTGEELAVVYHLHNLQSNCRIRFKVHASVNQPEVLRLLVYSPLLIGWKERPMTFLEFNLWDIQI